MPIKKGNKLVELREEVVKGLVMAYGSGLRAAPDFTTFVNELLLDVVKKEQFLSRYKPFSHLNYAGYHAGSIFIKDKQRKLVAEIISKMDWCSVIHPILLPIVSTPGSPHR